MYYKRFELNNILECMICCTFMESYIVLLFPRVNVLVCIKQNTIEAYNQDFDKQFQLILFEPDMQISPYETFFMNKLNEKQFEAVICF